MIDTTIEDKLFREFKHGGAAYLALEYVNIAHEKDSFDVYPKNWQEFYKIKLPQIVESRTDSYDDAPLFVSVDGERPLMWIEIESNISSCKTENDLNRYLYSLLLPFKEWSDSICPIPYIQQAKQHIELCKRNIPLHITRANSLDDGWDKDEALANAEACENAIKRDETRIKWLEGNYDRYLQIFKNAEKHSVEWYLYVWFDIFCTYADNLDALLLKFGIDLYAIQEKCGIWLKPKRDIISIMGYVGTLELTQTLISQLPQNTNTPRQKELPHDLCTPKAQMYFNKAIEQGLITVGEENWHWNKNTVLLSFMCGVIYCGDEVDTDGYRTYIWRFGAKQLPDAQLQRLFGENNIGQLRSNKIDNARKRIGSLPRGWQEIWQLFD